MSKLIAYANFIHKHIPRSTASQKYGLLSSSLRVNNLFTTFHYSSKNSFNSSSKPKWKKFLKTLGIGIGIGAVGSSLYLYSVYKKVNTPAIMNATTGEEYFLPESPPKSNITRSIRNPADITGLKITLYQFQTCPFCCKVRTVLDYYGFSYDVVEVNSVTHKESKWSSYRKVPFLLIEQEGVQTAMQLKDSSMIISALQSFISNKSNTLEEIVRSYPVVCYVNDAGEKKTDVINRYFLMYGDEPTKESQEEIMRERQWRKWIDDVYIHTLSPNVYRTMNEAFQAFNWFSKVGQWEEHFATWERLLVIYVGSLAMFFIGKRLKKRHGLKDDVRVSFYDETNIWLKEVQKGKQKFLGGKEPNLSDLGVYGVLTAVEGCDAFQDLLNNTNIKSWFSEMRRVVENHEGAKYLAQRGSNRS